MMDRQLHATIDTLEQQERAAGEMLTLTERFRAGADLFDYACRITRAGIRWQNPGWTDEQVEAELRQRLAEDRRREAIHDVV